MRSYWDLLCSVLCQVQNPTAGLCQETSSYNMTCIQVRYMTLAAFHVDSKSTTTYTDNVFVEILICKTFIFLRKAMVCHLTNKADLIL